MVQTKVLYQTPRIGVLQVSTALPRIQFRHHRTDREHLRVRSSYLREELIAVPRNKPGVQIKIDESLVGRKRLQKINVGAQPTNLELVESRPELLQSTGAVRIPRDQLRNHGVVEYRNVVPLTDPCINAHVRVVGLRGAHEGNVTAPRHKVFAWILGVDAGLKGMTMLGNFILLQWQGCTGRDFQLPLYEILSRYHFRDRMLHLEPGVHLHKVKLVRITIENELHGSCADVIHSPRTVCRGFPHASLDFGRESRCRSLFDDFLVPPLNRTVSIPQIHMAAVCIAKHLHLNVSGLTNVFLNQDAGISK
mmetsp:Transcript_7081/g.20072  ORF Transcript_7081/g.20072 Transcript_7081/m.20072 type:complete len:307 (-) Transcript_7081:711-1631(-)